jgi:CheY-like chemotaxis protein
MRSVPSQHACAPALILLVDDNKDGLSARRSVLEELGYEVTPASSGSDALNVAGQQDFDLVITDYKMAPMDGLELIAKLRGNAYRKPVILLTGFADSLGLSAENTGADVVIQKSANEVQNMVRQTKRLLAPPKKPAGSHPPTPRAFKAGGGK